MQSDFRTSALERLGDMFRGTHVCLFYETEHDLLEILGQYFSAGLANHEFCLWITQGISNGKATDALRQVMPSADRHLEAGRIELVSYQQWYGEGNEFDGARVIEAFHAKLTQALENGYTGVRVLANQARWQPIIEHEAHINDQFTGRPISIVCAYPRSERDAVEMIDIARSHSFIAAKRNGDWEVRAGQQSRAVKPGTERSAAEITASLDNRREESNLAQRQSLALRYGIAVLSVVVATLVLLWMYAVFNDAPHIALFLCAVVISASFGGVGPGLLSIALSILAFNYYFMVPSEAIDMDVARVSRLTTFVMVSAFIVWLTARQTKTTESLRQAGNDLKRRNQMLEAEIAERMQAEGALREAENRLQAAIDAAQIGLWDRDLHNGQMVWLGHQERLFGFAPGEFDGNVASFEKRVHPEDIEELRKVRQRALDERSEFRHEYRVVWPDGSIHWIAARGRFIYNEAGEPLRMYGAVLDLTDRKQMEDTLREQEELYRFLAENTSDLITLYDMDRNRVYVSPSFTRVLGGVPDIAFRGIHPEDVPASREIWKRILSGEKTVFIFRHAHADGSWRWLEAYGSLVHYRGQPHVMAVTRDITERKLAEEALRESQRRLQIAIQVAQMGIGEWDIRENRVYWSEELQRMFGHYPVTEDVTVEETFAWVHSEDRPLVIRRMDEALAGETEFGMDYRVVWANGSIHWLTAWAHLSYDDAGMPTRLVGAAMDITRRKETEQELHRYAARMEALLEISRTLAEAGLEYQSVLDTVARRTAELIGDSCVITLFAEDGQRSFPVAFHHTDAEARALMEEALLHVWAGGTDTERFQMLLAGEPIFIPVVDPEQYRAQSEPEFLPYVDRVGIASVLIVPLQTHGHVIGTLGLTRDRQGDPYTQEDKMFLQNIADRAALSIQNARLFAQVRSARERLAALSRRILEVQEAERRALTKELHDRVGQNLTALSINLQNIKAALSRETAQKLAVKFDDVQLLVEDTTREIRQLMAELHLPELEDYGLAAALETYTERAAARGNLTLVKRIHTLEPLLPLNIRIPMFRAAQEAITNVLKHAGATSLRVSLEEQDGRISLRVEDNGRGFDPFFVARKERQTWGLEIMRERVEAMGGSVQICSSPGRGTQVTFEITRPA